MKRFLVVSAVVVSSIAMTVGIASAAGMTADWLRVGSQDTGGVTYFNGTIINETTGDNDADNPVTFGDNVRIDGRVYRGATAGTADTLPFIVNDNMEVAGDLTVDGNITGNVSASSVMISDTSDMAAASSYLTSQTLQEALENEIAIDISSVLARVGSWEITNKTSDPLYEDTTGVLTFTSEGTATLDSGFLAALGSVAESDKVAVYNYVPEGESIDFEFINNSVVFATIPYETYDGDEADTGARAVFVFANNSDEIVLVGSGGSGVAGDWRISKLTPAD